MTIKSLNVSQIPITNDFFVAKRNSSKSCHESVVDQIIIFTKLLIINSRLDSTLGVKELLVLL